MVDFLVLFLNGLPTEAVLAFEFLALFSLLMFFIHFFRETGLFIFIVVSMIVANLQVLKIVQYTFYPDPIALGKVAICFTFLASDILVECYGKRQAYKGVLLGFSSNLCLMILMLITVGYSPTFIDKGVNFHEHLKLIFTPIPGVFLAGVCAFFVSQFVDISSFLKLKIYFNGKFIWLRSFLSTTIASFIDNIIFYTLAFSIFNDFSIDAHTLIFTYIVGTFIFRVAITALSSSIIYVAKLSINRPAPSY